MTLDTQGLFAVKPGMVIVVGALAGMTACAGHHLAGSRVKDFFADGMRERPVSFMASAADCIDGGLGHGRMVGAVGRMAVVAGICPLVAEFCCLVPFESRFVTFAADMAFFSLEQPFIITGMRGMAGRAAVITIPNQMIVG